MKRLIQQRCASLLLAACLLSACASTGQLVSAPDVSLRNVQMINAEYSGQTFLLGFDVTNPNPFPLPISTVFYGVELDGHYFAGGKALGGFTVPASGDGEFAISVRLDLLKTAPHLLFIVRDGATRDLPYKLKGKLGVDIPLAKSVHFESAGELRLQARDH